MGGLGLFVVEVLRIAILAAVTIVVIRYFLFKPFYVKGASMEPNFYDHEYLIIDELSYRLREPVRGEVIVFRYPNNPEEYFLKRIVALPGERIKISAGKVAIYNADHPEGIAVKENYLPHDLATLGEKISTLGQDEYFVLGDNRPNSFDSRRFGPIHKSAIVGRALFRGWPVSRIEKFESPGFNL
ncbi:MAG: signal peptidase I [Candidatus Magasanikbacteria bacterium RIFCSPLOWO2_02_FULL_44_11]|uniref:Signal peptidase I n=2 Tax=Candidatus Magasanikiibacteriota TaxID=1752731 RepID=A0A1F6NAP0_9BACT|nr:MAG: signal peptidase I [Candidatus Magasanikbacteria bacterium RIFCSPHIGHO2_02_FULL_45_10]OGH80858.1 MAG: signal peptidase I [Candidatus Magasanikbacteria bacterium RIFCSPLOWO2_02_FULL_44_11]